MTSASDALPSDLAAAHAMIVAERAARKQAEAAAAHAKAEAANAQADLSGHEALSSLNSRVITCLLRAPELIGNALAQSS